MKKSGIFRSFTLIIALPLLLFWLTALFGCNSSHKETTDSKVKPGNLKLSVLKIEQLSKLGDKIPDGQYLVTQVNLENTGNQSLTFNPNNFSLQNITTKEEERYSQPIEKGMSWTFREVYGDVLSNKLIDYQEFSVYPRMKIERYFVFMVPSNADIYKYQIAESTTETSTPLVTAGITKVYDHRNAPDNIPTNE